MRQVKLLLLMMLFLYIKTAPGIHSNGDNRTGAGDGDDEVINLICSLSHQVPIRSFALLQSIRLSLVVKHLAWLIIPMFA